MRQSSRVNSERRKHLFEVLVFLFLIVPSMALSFLVVKQGDMSFVVTAVSSILRDLSLVCLILYFLWCNGEKLTEIGWKVSGTAVEVLIGAILFVPVFFLTALVERTLQKIGFSVPATPLPSALAANGAGEFLLAGALVVIVAVSEETIFRGYLINRLQRVTKHWLPAAVLSSVIFSLGHGYEGAAGVITVGALGLSFALVYRWRGNLIAPMTMHFLQDFLGIVLLPLLRLGRGS
jgi:membrane protease YdiL (CAAX protease family)